MTGRNRRLVTAKEVRKPELHRSRSSMAIATIAEDLAIRPRNVGELVVVHPRAAPASQVPVHSTQAAREQVAKLAKAKEARKVSLQMAKRISSSLQ